VVFIWGFIGYKIYKVTYPSDELLQVENTAAVFKPKEIKEAEKFTVNLNYRDPFLGKFKVGKTKKKSKKIKVIPITFPPISYKGMLTSKKRNKSVSVFFVMINNKENFLSVGEKVDGVKMLHGNKKEIKVSFKGIKKVISIQ
jgi:hypothetical protein